MGVADGLERLERAESRRRKWNQKVGGGTGEARCGPDGFEFRSPPPLPPSPPASLAGRLGRQSLPDSTQAQRLSVTVWEATWRNHSQEAPKRERRSPGEGASARERRSPGWRGETSIWEGV